MEVIAILSHRIGRRRRARVPTTSASISFLATRGCRIDRTHAWQEIKGEFGFPTETLFEYRGLDNQPAGIEVARLVGILNSVRPEAVLIAGSAGRLALAGMRWSLDNKVPSVVISDNVMWNVRRRWRFIFWR